MKKEEIQKKLLFVVFVPLCICFGENKASAQLVACYMTNLVPAEGESATATFCIQTPIHY